MLHYAFSGENIIQNECFSKGAAFGIAGIIKGLGILSLKQLDVMGKLIKAIQEKKSYRYREGKADFNFI